MIGQKENGLGIVELFEKLGGDRQVIAAGELFDRPNVSEGSTHDNCLVSMLLVVAAQRQLAASMRRM